MNRTLLLTFVSAAAVAAAAASCDGGADGGGGSGAAGATTSGAGGAGGAAHQPVTPAPPGQPWPTLGEWNLFTDIAARTPNARVVPYDLISPLFSDYTSKFRFAYLPEGATVAYSDTEEWSFPVGAILVKTFAYPQDPAAPTGPQDLLETRLLVREADGWKAHVYIYEAGDADATLSLSGGILTVDAVTSGQAPITSYYVPNPVQCLECHTKDDVPRHLGPSTRQLDRDLDYGAGPVNQLDHWLSIGFLDQAPAPPGQRVRLAEPFDAANPDVEYRVRSYFDANCAHCHSAGGVADTSSLRLDLAGTAPGPTQPANVGVCVAPTSGSCPPHTFDVVPGDPAQSIMVCRMSAAGVANNDVRMPPIGLQVHDEGVALVSEWIAGLTFPPCN